MTSILKHTKKQKTERIALALPLIFLTALIAVSCKSADKFPTKRVFETDTDHGVCTEYRITDLEHMKYEFAQYHPIEKCNGVFGFAPEDTPKVMDWIADVIQKVKTAMAELI